MRTAKTLIRLGGCWGWSESSLGTYAISLVGSFVLSWDGSFVISNIFTPVLYKPYEILLHITPFVCYNGLSDRLVQTNCWKRGFYLLTSVSVIQTTLGVKTSCHQVNLNKPDHARISLVPCPIMTISDQDTRDNARQMSRCTTKPTKWLVRPAKTQISLRFLDSWRPSAYSCGKWRLWSDWADAQANLSLRWAHRSFCQVLSYCGSDVDTQVDGQQSDQ